MTGDVFDVRGRVEEFLIAKYKMVVSEKANPTASGLITELSKSP